MILKELESVDDPIDSWKPHDEFMPKLIKPKEECDCDSCKFGVGCGGKEEAIESAKTAKDYFITRSEMWVLGWNNGYKKAEEEFTKNPDKIIPQDKVVVNIEERNKLIKGYINHLHMVRIDDVLETFNHVNTLSREYGNRDDFMDVLRQAIMKLRK